MPSEPVDLSLSAMTEPSSFSKASSSSGRAAAGATASSRGGGRKGRQVQDVNHLLGFTLPPRAPPQPSSGPPRRSNRRNNAQSYHGSFDRARYIHTFRFVVKPDKDYTANLADHDVRLDWSDILQVILPTASSALSTVSTSTAAVLDQQPGATPTCPICLSEPTAARMTKCGHVFCFPCILHYLALADGQKWRKCPVCWDSIYAKDLKVVKWHDAVTSAQYDSSPTSDLAALSLGDDPVLTTFDHSRSTTAASTFASTSTCEPLKMRLIRRVPISTLALPRSDTWPSEAVPPLRAPWNFSPDAFTFAKFMLGSPDYLKQELDTNMKELEREVQTLKKWGKQGGSDEELGIVFVKSAMDKIKDQLEKVEAFKANTSVMTARKKALREIQEIRDQEGKRSLGPPLPLFSETSSSDVEDAPSEFLGLRSTSGGGRMLSGDAPTFSPGNMGSLNPSIAVKGRQQRRNVNPQPPFDAEQAYYFYQAASGQNIYLHPLDIKILKSHFGTYQGMPDTISVQVEGADEGSMNDELRRRCKWLAHLPTSCDVVFIEADLSSVVTASSLEPYSQALKQRRTKRRDKARREDKAKLKSEQKEVDSRPVYQTTYGNGSFEPWPMTNYNHPSTTQMMINSETVFPRAAAPASTNANSWSDAHGFPSSSSPPRAPIANSTAPSWGQTVSSNNNRSFASALHSSSRGLERASQNEVWDDPDFDERWHEFEDRIGASGGGGGGGGGRKGGSASGSNAGGGSAGRDSNPNAKQTFGGKKKGRKAALTLNLSGAAMRGTG